MTAAPTDQGQLASALAQALRERLGTVTIYNLTRLSGGASRETWAFDAVGADGSRSELILRRDPPSRPSEPGAMGREARAIASAQEAGLAVPEVLLSSNKPDLFGSAGLVMRRIPGETIARRILRDDRYAPAREALVGQLASFAAGLHALKPPADLPAPDPLADLVAKLGEFDYDGGVFELAIEALSADRPPPRDPVTVHGDLRLGNLIVGEHGLNAVIDWELVHAGDPAEDLGWLCVKAWRFGAPGPAAGLGTQEELLTGYQQAGGASISADELRWWEILGTLRWGVICLNQAWAHLSGLHRSVELAAIGRRVAEQEWDLLTLLRPDEAAEAAARRPQPSADPKPVPAPQGRPTASELLDAVRGFLTDQVMPATGGQLGFHARVAANVLAIVARELDLDPPPAGASLADEVAARLAVANPRYF
ncbi:MAG TPA: phosphotransferase [Streptosporangiaceae bacterium]|nr:phosphotransferase [Streptosporangiaceae bacterium]